MDSRQIAFEAATRIIKDLEQFGFSDIDLDNAREFDLWVETLYQRADNVPYDFAEGATRKVIIPENENFVIKLMPHYTTEANGFDEIDYNGNEAMIYAEAEKQNLSDYFAACWKLPAYTNNRGTYNLYIMEKCEVDYERTAECAAEFTGNYACSHWYEAPDGEQYEDWEIEDLSSEEREVLESYSMENGDYGCYEDMLCLADEKWGVENERKVVNFLEYYGVNDCHAGNWGWDTDGNLKLTDYAGYCRNLCSNYYEVRYGRAQ